jgi:hypothetical protein
MVERGKQITYLSTLIRQILLCESRRRDEVSLLPEYSYETEEVAHIEFAVDLRQLGQFVSRRHAKG